MLKPFVARDIDRLRAGPHLLHVAQLVHFVVQIVAVPQAPHQRHVAEFRLLLHQIDHQLVAIDDFMERQDLLQFHVPLDVFRRVDTDHHDHFVEHFLRLLQNRQVPDMERVERARVDADARPPPFQILHEEVDRRLALREAFREPLEERAAPFAVIHHVQILELAEDLEFVFQQIDVVSTDDDLTVVLMETRRHFRRRILRLRRLDGLPNQIRHIRGQRIAQTRHDEIERLDGLVFAVVVLRIPDDIVEQRRDEQLRRHDLVVPRLLADAFADIQKMLQRMEIAMRLAIGGEHLVQPFAFIVQTIVVAFRKQLANPLFRLFHVHLVIPIN